MANTIAVEEVKLVEKEEKMKIKLNSACHSLSFSVYIASRESGLTVDESRANSNTAYWQCMGAALPKSISAN
ncbi:hypothetical protein WFZ85_10435 [Flavobacterium sp. j3]|uniref:Uncharacterized protein n=1 Tax=Flavobacterium aureirubrum TaxID=3133147 RepID=A0ABU9N5R1_9FLAO